MASGSKQSKATWQENNPKALAHAKKFHQQQQNTAKANNNNMNDNTMNTKGAQIGKGLKVFVTKEIIATAIPANSGHCMISDAVKAAAISKGWRIGKVLTDLQTIRFTKLDKKQRFIYFTPQVGQRALLNFDQGRIVEPFAFRLTPVQIIESQPKEAGTARSKIAAKARHGRPVKLGGKAMATMVGLRREYGLRQMGVAPQ